MLIATVIMKALRCPPSALPVLTKLHPELQLTVPLKLTVKVAALESLSRKSTNSPHCPTHASACRTSTAPACNGIRKEQQQQLPPAGRALPAATGAGVARPLAETATTLVTSHDRFTTASRAWSVCGLKPCTTKTTAAPADPGWPAEEPYRQRTLWEFTGAGISR